MMVEHTDRPMPMPARLLLESEAPLYMDELNS
jgi:hypothetical protein